MQKIKVISISSIFQNDNIFFILVALTLQAAIKKPKPLLVVQLRINGDPEKNSS